MPKKKQTSPSKIFILDTSVILYDHSAIKSFQEHDVGIPITVLEELDQFKKGNDTKNFEAREFIRYIDKHAEQYNPQEWQPLNGPHYGNFAILMHGKSSVDAEKIFNEQKSDHRILNAALYQQEINPHRKIILVTKDINLRLKAKALGLAAEDYETGKIKNLESLYKGKKELKAIPLTAIDALYQNGATTTEEAKITEPIANQYFILKHNKTSVLAQFNPNSQQLKRVDKLQAYGIKPRNAEQAFALDAIMNEQIKLVSLQGVAGTGKTLLALAGALEQRKIYKQIFLARPIVPLSNKDIGYLPGDIKSKLNPYMEPLWDNLKYIQNQFKETEKEHQKITELLNTEKLVIQPLAYIRGRSLSNICFIIDEAQNLTPHEVKTIISRAGEGTKIIFTGDIYQIDTPYLDSQSNGLSFMIDRLQNQALYAHVQLEKGERSALANLANELL